MKKVILAGLSVLVLTGWTTKNVRRGPETIVRIQIGADNGGPYNDYVARAAAMRQARQAPAFTAACKSGCTWLMGLQGACAYPTASFHFHSPIMSQLRFSPMTIEQAAYWTPDKLAHYWSTGRVHEYVTRQWLAHLPSHVADVIRRYSALNSEEWFVLPASVLPPC